MKKYLPTQPWRSNPYYDNEPPLVVEYSNGSSFTAKHWRLIPADNEHTLCEISTHYDVKKYELGDWSNNPDPEVAMMVRDRILECCNAIPNEFTAEQFLTIISRAAFFEGYRAAAQRCNGSAAGVFIAYEKYTAYEKFWSGSTTPHQASSSETTCAYRDTRGEMCTVQLDVEPPSGPSVWKGLEPAESFLPPASEHLHQRSEDGSSSSPVHEVQLQDQPQE